MNAAEHLARSETLLAELETGDPESFQGSRQIVALAALAHATIAAGIQAGVPITQVRTGKPLVCLTCGYSEQSHTADSGPQGTGCTSGGPWAEADSPAGRAAAREVTA